jgi:deferrochelatase/peroxidase EfeB
MTIETWDRQPLSEQERVIGRTKAEGAPLSGGGEFSQPDFHLKGNDGKPLVAADAHVRLVHPTNNAGAKMLRRGYNFVDGVTAWVGWMPGCSFSPTSAIRVPTSFQFR